MELSGSVGGFAVSVRGMSEYTNFDEVAEIEDVDVDRFLAKCKICGWEESAPTRKDAREKVRDHLASEHEVLVRKNEPFFA